MPSQDDRGNRAARNMDRPMPRQEDRGSRSGQPYNAPRPDNYRRPEMRPSDYQPSHGQNAGPRGGGQDQGRGEDRGKGHDRH